MEKKTILIVEDDEVVRDMIKGTLEREYCVMEAAKCSEALEQIQNHCDLALIDYDLPDGDGFEVLSVNCQDIVDRKSCHDIIDRDVL